MSVPAKNRIFLVISLAFLGACARLQVDAPLVVQGDLVSTEERAIAIKGIAAKHDELRSFKILSRSLIQQGEEKARVRHALVAELPSRLRVEMLAPQAAYSLSVLTAHENQLVAVDTVARRAVRASDSRKLMQKLFSLPATVDQISYLLVGRIWDSALRQLSAGEGQLRIDAAQNLYRWISGDGSVFVEINSHNFLLTYMEIRDQFNSHLLARVRYGDALESGGLQIPSTVQTELLKEHQTMSFAYSSISLNGPVAPSLFEFKIPDDYTVYGEQDEIPAPNEFLSK